MSIKSIHSRDNPLYKEVRLLAGNTQARRKAGRSVLDGIHLCQAFLDQAGMPEICLFSDSAQHEPEVADIIARCEKGAATCVMLDDRLFGQLSQVEQGISLLFVIRTPLVPALKPINENAVLLDNVQDPGNVGSIIRSAAAAGVRQILCSPGTAFAWSSKVLRAGMGAHFVLEIHENVDLEASIRDARIPVLATSSHAEKSIYQTDLSAPVAWLFGHEGKGVAPELLEMASARLSIPHLGPVESLNVGSSAAVCLFEQVRQTLAAAVSSGVGNRL